MNRQWQPADPILTIPDYEALLPWNVDKLKIMLRYAEGVDQVLTKKGKIGDEGVRFDSESNTINSD